jgi:hypothetical protein
MTQLDPTPSDQWRMFWLVIGIVVTVVVVLVVL